MTDHARVVVVGGGIMGVGLLYHLTKEGWSDAVLLEKAELTSGSTWHAAGQITHATSSFTLGKMVGYGIELYKRIEAETEQSATFHDCGSFRLAYTDDAVDWLKHTLSVGATLGHPMDLVDVPFIRARHPFYNLDGVKAALWTPEDGHLDPAGATFALARGARMGGATIVRQCRATDIEPLPSGEWRVVTEQGDWVCEHVVNAGGTYARQVGRWVGLDLPITCMTHHYLVTDTVPEFLELDTELPVVRDDPLVSGYIRMEQKSGLIGIYEKADPNAVWLDGTPWEVENALFDPDYDRIMPWLENALARMPILADKGIRRTVHGAITHPPDGNMMLGPVGGLKNFWCCCGAQIGIAWGPGAGKYLAQWMVHGAADVSMREFDPRRYGAFADSDYAVTKAKEDYLLRHEIPFPHFNRTAGRPVKASGLFDRLKQRGAIHEEVFGWERPRWFAGGGIPREDVHGFRRTVWHDAVAREVKAVRERVGVMDISAFAKIEVSGADAWAFTDRMIANRAPTKTGRMVLSHVLNKSGRIECETTVVRIADDRFYFVCAAFFEIRLCDWLSQHVADGEDVTVANMSERLGALALQGPNARDVLRQVTQAPLDNESFPWLRHRDIEVAGVTVRALRLSYAGELGWELHVPMDGIAQVYDALVEAGRDHGIADYGSFAMNTMRLEKMFKGASELTNEVTLPEADVMRFVKMGKDFVGKTATQAALDDLERKWVCAYLGIDETDVDCHGSEAVFSNGTRVGAVSSGGYGHAVRRSLAFAYLKPEHAVPGTNLDVMILGDRRPATVLGAPAYDPDNLLPRS